MFRQDAQWWAGALGSAIGAAVALAKLPHPWDTYGAAIAAGLMAFSFYKITPGDSIKKE